jgi:hypothetical protein
MKAAYKQFISLYLLLACQAVGAYPTASDAYYSSDDGGGSNDGLAVIGGILLILIVVFGSNSTRFNVFRFSGLLWLPLLLSKIGHELFGSHLLVTAIGMSVGFALWVPFMSWTDKWSK